MPWVPLGGTCQLSLSLPTTEAEQEQNYVKIGKEKRESSCLSKGYKNEQDKNNWEKNLKFICSFLFFFKQSQLATQNKGRLKA